MYAERALFRWTRSDTTADQTEATAHKSTGEQRRPTTISCLRFHRHMPWRLTACTQLSMSVDRPAPPAVLAMSVVMVFSCRHARFFQWTVWPPRDSIRPLAVSLTSMQSASSKHSASGGAGAALQSARGGTFDLCVEFTDHGHGFCYPIVAFLLVDINVVAFSPSLLCFAVATSRRQRNSAGKLTEYSLRAQTFGFLAAVLSSLFAVVTYVVSAVHLQGDHLVAGFSVTGGLANAALSGAALAVPYLYELLGRKRRAAEGRGPEGPFDDAYAVTNTQSKSSREHQVDGMFLSYLF